jgi:SET domain-containing protein
VYKPLPDSVTVTTSKINGLGLFAKENIPQATNLGTSHVKVGDKIIRTPLGGFINHANYPNCVKVELHSDQELNAKRWSLITIKDINKGEEITLKYTFYNI